MTPPPSAKRIARLREVGPTGETLEAVADVHRSAAFSLSVYGHLFDADLDDLAARLDSTSGGPHAAPALLDTIETRR